MKILALIKKISSQKYPIKKFMTQQIWMYGKKFEDIRKNLEGNLLLLEKKTSQTQICWL